MLKFDRDVWPPTPDSISFNTYGEHLIQEAEEAVRLEEEGLSDGKISDDKMKVCELGSYVCSTLISTFGVEESLPLYESLSKRMESEELRKLFWIDFKVFAQYHSGEATKVQFNPELGKHELVVPQA